MEKRKKSRLNTRYRNREKIKSLVSLTERVRLRVGNQHACCVVITDTLYNKTKSGVDVLDEMCATYSTSRKTRRWPLVIFFRLLVIAGINSMVIYSRNNPKSTMVRREFLREIAVEMIKPAISRPRAAISSLPKRIKRNATKMTRDQRKNSESSTKAAKQNEGSQGSECAGRCVKCPRSRDIKTKCQCVKCLKKMCQVHMVSVCDDCYNIHESDCE